MIARHPCIPNYNICITSLPGVYSFYNRKFCKICTEIITSIFHGFQEDCNIFDHLDEEGQRHSKIRYKVRTDDESNPNVSRTMTQLDEVRKYMMIAIFQEIECNIEKLFD